MAAPGAEKRAAAAKAAAEKADAAPAAPAATKKAAPAAKAAGARKSKDKWKAKEWYNVHAPRMFNETVIGETPAVDPEYLIGRKAEVTVQDLNGDMSKMYIKLIFKINDVDGHEAKTEFIGHNFTSDYIRRLTRRKKTKTDHVVDVTTADNYVLRIKTMSIADRRIQASQEDAMRSVIRDTLTQYAADRKLADVVKSIINNDLAKELAKSCRTIIPIRRIEIRKSEVLRNGQNSNDVISDFVPAEPAPAEEPASEEAPAEDAAPAEEAAPAEDAPEEKPAEEAPAEEPAADEKTE